MPPGSLPLPAPQGDKALLQPLPLGVLQRVGKGTHQLKLLPELGDDNTGVCRVLCHAHELGQGQLLPAVLLQGLSLMLGEAPVLGPVGLGWVGLICHLRRGRLLMFSGFSFWKATDTEPSDLHKLIRA